MQLADGDNALNKVRCLAGIGLMQHALVSVACGAGLVCVYSWDYEKLVRCFLLYLSQAGYIVEDRSLVVRRAGTDNKNKLIRFSRENAANLRVSLLFDLFCFLRNGKTLLELLGDCQLLNEFNVLHSLASLFLSFA